MSKASGTFEITMNPSAPYDVGPTASLGRISITKQFRGDLEGTSSVEMLSARSTVSGSAGYVAIERVTASLHGRKGTFVLQHSGTMDRGTATLTVSVVPDSGSDALAGLAGRMTIEIVDGQHRYGLDYTLDDPSHA